jgi:hypothetical protein
MLLQTWEGYRDALLLGVNGRHASSVAPNYPPNRTPAAAGQSYSPPLHGGGSGTAPFLSLNRLSSAPANDREFHGLLSLSGKFQIESLLLFEGENYGERKGVGTSNYSPQEKEERKD